MKKIGTKNLVFSILIASIMILSVVGIMNTEGPTKMRQIDVDQPIPMELSREQEEDTTDDESDIGEKEIIEDDVGFLGSSKPSFGPLSLSSTYDYVIITTNDIVANSKRLGNFIYMKELMGHSVMVVTEDDFDGLTGELPNGRAEKIRQWLMDNDGPLGIDYVLLIGNPDPDDPVDPADPVGDIPMKATMHNHFNWGIREVPTDMFYADLDGDWDLDDDGYYAENLELNHSARPHPTLINEDYFSVNYTGYLYCDFDEEYQFHTYSDGGVRLWIDGDLVIENWDDLTEHPPTNDYGWKTLTSGYHDITLKYKEHTGDAFVQLYWRTTAGVSEPTYLGHEIVPRDHLRNETNTEDGLTSRFYNNIDLNGTPDLVRDYYEVIDDIWGTGDIGQGGPENDADVWVGRIPVYDNNYEELDSILGKIIQYETDSGDISWRESILLPMYPVLGTMPNYYYGEAVLNNYAIPASFDYFRIYANDYDPMGGPTPEFWPTSMDAVENEWANGYGVVTWYTHGSYSTAAHVFESSRIYSLDDSKPAFTYLASCNNAYPEMNNNLAYSLLKHGAIATVGATRITIGAHGNWTYNPASMINPNFGYAYCRGIIQDGLPAGQALAEAKRPTGGVHLNELAYVLYGDPETYLLTTFPNRLPVVDVNRPYFADEGTALVFDGTGSYDPEGDSLEYRWDLDGDGVWDTTWSSDPNATYTWGDDYTGNVTLQVRDLLGLIGENTTTVTVNNVEPTIENFEAYIFTDFTLRAAGEKWHNVEMYIYENDTEIGYAEVVRYPGSPDDQSVTLVNIRCNVTEIISVKVIYTPDDDTVNGQPNGATPCWVTISFEDGGFCRTHHTFKVKHPDTWEWIFDVNQCFVGHEITFEAEASDLGSDDLTFTWNWNDSTPDTVTVYFNDGIGPDPYPSPGGIYPISQFDWQGHVFTANGVYVVQLIVTDDDCQPWEWECTQIRRLEMFLEESLYSGTQWVVFDPDD